MAILYATPTIDGLRIRLKPVDGTPMAQVDAGDKLTVLETEEQARSKIGVEGEWIKVRTTRGVEGYTAAWYLRLLQYTTPTTEGLRLRLKPVDGTPIAQVSAGDVLAVLDKPDEVENKIGVEGEWIKVRTIEGVDAYAAAWYLEEYTGEVPDAPPAPASAPEPVSAPVSAPAPSPAPAPAVTPTGNFLGVNLDHFHPLGTPDPARLGGLGWVRFGYNVSANRGSEDIEAAYNTYRPLAERYARAGVKVMFAFTHQTYGEGKDEFWPWADMTDDKWRKLTGPFVDMVKRIAQQYAGQDLVHCWQIWNEQDAPKGAVASVPMSPQNYAHLLSETIQAIRSVDSKMLLISGGHTGGPGRGSQYASNTIAAMPSNVRPDGIAFHPYGRGILPDPRYANWGHIEESMKAYTSILPKTPVWITEWGCLDKEGDPAADIAKYASTFIEYINQHYPGKVGAAIWYAWAMGMHNGYGLVGRDDQPLEPLFGKFLSL